MPEQTLQEALDAMNTAEITALDTCVSSLDTAVEAMKTARDLIPTNGIPSVARSTIDSMIASVDSYKYNMVMARSRYNVTSE